MKALPKIPVVSVIACSQVLCIVGNSKRVRPVSYTSTLLLYLVFSNTAFDFARPRVQIPQKIYCMYMKHSCPFLILYLQLIYFLNFAICKLLSNYTPLVWDFD